MAEATQVVFPHLVVSDAAAALDFYKKALGATENLRMPAEDGKGLMHADLTINGGKVYLPESSRRRQGTRRRRLRARRPRALMGTVGGRGASPDK